MTFVETMYDAIRCGSVHQVREGKRIQNWGVFHAALDDNNVNATPSTISFNPIIMSNPTDHQTIYTTLRLLKEAMNNFGQPYAPIVFEMCLLMKALEITWAHPRELKLVLFEGGMHLVMSVISAIGVRYGDAGLNLLDESGVFAVGSVQID